MQATLKALTRLFLRAFLKPVLGPPFTLGFQRRWLALFQAVGARNAARMAEHGAALLERKELQSEAREYLLLAAMSGAIASGDKARALELWGSYSPGVTAQRAVFRLLRCHAGPENCAAAFRSYAER